MAKMTVDRLIERCIQKIQEDDFDEEFILEVLNQCNVDIASNIYVKELACTSEVTVLADENTVSLPDNYHRNLSNCQIDNKNIAVRASKRLIDKSLYDTSRSGDIAVVAVNSNELYCQRKPYTDTILTLYYHCLPDELEEGEEFPFYIPENFIYNLFFNFAVAHMYDYLEDAIDGEKVNTLIHEDRYNTALTKLRLFIGEDPDEPFMPVDYNRNFDFGN